MVRISAKKVRKDIYLKINEQFADFIGRMKTGKESRRFLQEFLTPAERIMFSKRLALICMLEHGYSFTAIRKSLKVSESTVVRLWKIFRQGKLPLLKSKIREEKARKEFWEKLEKVINAGLPPRGRGRWRNVYRMLRKP